MLASPNIPFPLTVTLADGNTTLFLRGRIYNSVGTLIDTVSIPHIAEGMYMLAHTFTTEGVFNVIYQLFTDAGFTTPAVYDKEADQIDVSSFKTNILKILGLLHHNTIIDHQVYNGTRQLLSGRVRAYDSKVNADAAGLTGLLFTWTVTATYTDSNLSFFKITLNP